ncbi:MAG: hypothetical protein ICV63_04135 [Coleofasciculus sp. Co-bin14]|nr:hypothetical protein [Coleofasciculus sp. Co-bin14]
MPLSLQRNAPTLHSACFWQRAVRHAKAMTHPTGLSYLKLCFMVSLRAKRGNLYKAAAPQRLLRSARNDNAQF